MKTDNYKFTRHLFEIVSTDFKYNLYKLQQLLNGNNSLPDIVRIEGFRKLSQGTGFNELLIIKDQSHWNKCKLSTGMRPLTKKNCFYGDIRQMAPNGKPIKSFLIVQYDSSRETLVIDYFKNFYPFQKELRSLITDNHNYYFENLAS